MRHATLSLSGAVTSHVQPTESPSSRRVITSLSARCKRFGPFIRFESKAEWSSSLLIAFLTWFLGHTLYNRFFLKRHGREIFPFPNFGGLKLPTTLSGSKGTGNKSGPKWGSWRRSDRSRSGYSNVRADEHEHDEQEGFAGRFSLEDDEFDEDERELSGSGLGEDRDAWRDIPGRADDSAHDQVSNGKGKGKVGVHQGLTQV